MFMALRAGGRAGYVLKDAEEEEMVLSIRAVGKESHLQPGHRRTGARLLRGPQALCPAPGFST